MKGQVFLGSEAFLTCMQQKTAEREHELEHPRAQRQAAVQSLDDYAAKATYREEAMKNAYATGAYTLKAIADYFGVHYSTVSRVVNQ